MQHRLGAEAVGCGGAVMERGALGASGERSEVILLVSHSFNELPPAVNSVLQGALGSLFVLVILRADPLSVVGGRGVGGEEFSVPGRLDIRHPARLPPGLHVHPDLLLEVLQSRRETGGEYGLMVSGGHCLPV